MGENCLPKEAIEEFDVNIWISVNICNPIRRR
jgi:hypothetical protein